VVDGGGDHQDRGDAVAPAAQEDVGLVRDQRQDHLYFSANPVITRVKKVVKVRKCCTRSERFKRS